MAEITVALIKTLRDKTNAGMMDCKAALNEAGGDIAELFESGILAEPRGYSGTPVVTPHQIGCDLPQ